MSIESHHLAASNFALRNALRLIAITSTDESTRTIALDTLGESLPQIHNELDDYQLLDIQMTVPDVPYYDINAFDRAVESISDIQAALMEYELLDAD